MARVEASAKRSALLARGGQFVLLLLLIIAVAATAYFVARNVRAEWWRLLRAVPTWHAGQFATVVVGVLLCEFVLIATFLYYLYHGDDDRIPVALAIAGVGVATFGGRLSWLWFGSRAGDRDRDTKESD